jgi:hypothetical protein
MDLRDDETMIVLAGPTEQKLALQISKAAKITLTETDIQDWMSGGAGYDRTDAAVQKILGTSLYSRAADLVPYVVFEKFGMGNLVPAASRQRVKQLLTGM